MSDNSLMQKLDETGNFISLHIFISPISVPTIKVITAKQAVYKGIFQVVRCGLHLGVSLSGRTQQVADVNISPG